MCQLPPPCTCQNAARRNNSFSRCISGRRRQPFFCSVVTKYKSFCAVAISGASLCEQIPELERHIFSHLTARGVNSLVEAKSRATVAHKLALVLGGKPVAGLFYLNCEKADSRFFSSSHFFFLRRKKGRFCPCTYAPSNIGGFKAILATLFEAHV